MAKQRSTKPSEVNEVLERDSVVHKDVSVKATVVPFKYCYKPIKGQDITLGNITISKDGTFTTDIELSLEEFLGSYLTRIEI